MDGILMSFVIIIGIFVFASIVNEKKIHVVHDVALLATSFLIGVIFVIIKQIGIFPFIDNIINTMQTVQLDDFLLECTIGFIMFANASKIHLIKFVKNILPIRCSFSNNNICFHNDIWFFVFCDKFII